MNYQPHQCVILAIDPGRRSGWCVATCGYVEAAGSATTQRHRSDAVALALEVAAERALPLVVVGEKWTPGGRYGGARTMAGLGAQWGLWLAEVEPHVAARRIVRVYAQTWRARVLGGGRGITTAQWHARARDRAQQALRREAGSDDEAEAVCIAVWAAYADEVGAVMPKRRRP